MPLTVFISHAGPDAAIAKRIADSLRMSDHDVIVDTDSLNLGDDVISFINDSIERSQFVIILFSKHSQSAKWQREEATIAIHQEIESSKNKCMVIRLDSSPIPPIFRPKIYAKYSLEVDDDQQYETLINKLCQAIRKDHAKASLVVSSALAPGSGNPFRHIRAEHFENDSDSLVQAFAPLDRLKMGTLYGMQPCFLEGPRGTGKSMLLLSIRARNFLQNFQEHPSSNRIFGFYVKLTPGALCNSGADLEILEDDTFVDVSRNDYHALLEIANQEIVLALCESLITEIDSCVQRNLIPMDFDTQRNFSDSISHILFEDDKYGSTNSLTDLRDNLSQIHRQIATFIRRRFTYKQEADVPVVTFDLNALIEIIALAKRHITFLRDFMFVALLDEYENLRPLQRRIINTIIKLAPPNLSVKVAKKIGISDVSGTTIGQELQETHDYRRIDLVYDVTDKNHFAQYRILLSSIVDKQIRVTAIEYKNMDSLLPASKEFCDGISEEQICTELKKMEMERRPRILSAENGSTQQCQFNHYREAAIYRVLARTRTNKHFSGFKKVSMLSSGIIRYFQEILGVAYYLTTSTTQVSTRELYLPPEHQTEAVHRVSENALTTLSKNVETYGEILKYLLLDLGQCLRQKLLKHPSEPEAARITIIDPELLGTDDYQLLRTVLNIGVREAVFQTRDGRPAFRPRHGSDPQEVEFNICRILAPVLQISPRLRWRTRIKSKTLNGLVATDLDQRKTFLQELVAVALNNKTRNEDSIQKELFDSHETLI